MKKDTPQHNLGSADVFTVASSLPDRKYVCDSQATFNKNFNEFVLSAKYPPMFLSGARKQATRIVLNYDI